MFAEDDPRAEPEAKIEEIREVIRLLEAALDDCYAYLEPLARKRPRSD